MREPKLDLEVSDNQKAVLIVACPECGDESRFLLDEVSHGTSVLCNCGAVLNITDDSLKSSRRKLDKIKKKQD